MKCPQCGSEMKLKSESISNDGKGKDYNRKIFMCEMDDVWVTIETPRKTLV